MEAVRWLFFLYTLPVRAAFFLYVSLPLAVLSVLYSFVCTQFVLLYEVRLTPPPRHPSTFLQISLRRSQLFRVFVRQFSALWSTVSCIFRQAAGNKVHNVQWILATIVEVVLTYLFSLFVRVPAKDLSRQLSYELIDYEEDQDEPTSLEGKSVLSLQRLRMSKVMHHYVPANTFRATVRSRPGRRELSADNLRSHTEDVEELCTPSSFPSTPFSLARVMSRSSDRTEDVMFAARDKLRLQESHQSSDNVSRTIAAEAARRRAVAAFDPSLLCQGLLLTSGNHCAQKVGRGLCSSCRATVTVLPETFIYFEISVMTSSDREAPVLAAGLAPPDCPLNVMVGSWAQSLALYSDGSLLVGSKWSKNSSGISISAGSTIGILCRLSSSPKPQKGDDDEASSSDESEEDMYVQSNPLQLLVAFGHLFGMRQNRSPPATNEAQSRSRERWATDSDQSFFAFNVNGTVLSFVDNVEKSIQNELKLHPPLYPTVSILSEQTKVWCRFDQQDIVYRSRRSIGAPAAVRVYCLDGSVLLTESDP